MPEGAPYRTVTVEVCGREVNVKVDNGKVRFFQSSAPRAAHLDEIPLPKWGEGRRQSAKLLKTAVHKAWETTPRLATEEAKRLEAKAPFLAVAARFPKPAVPGVTMHLNPGEITGKCLVKFTLRGELSTEEAAEVRAFWTAMRARSRQALSPATTAYELLTRDDP
jgi:hypothetical protein